MYLYSNSSDPWSASTTSAALAEVKAYWLANRLAVTRTVTHFMSGKGNGQGGIAYVGVLCNGTYGYGVSMSLGGNFSVAQPQIIWDSVVIAHEIGHNFGSPHTHEWDTQLSGSPVDCCYKNPNSSGICSASPGSLPGIGSLSGGTSGTGAGTIMSYCHQLSPGYSNLSFTFGLNHTKGVSPARVPTQMRTTVENAAAAAPSCFVAAPIAQTITFGAAPSVVVGGTGTVSATGGGSGLPVTFSSLTTSICTVSGSNGSTVLGVAAGTCNIAANQAGNSSYSAAVQVTQSFAITAPTIAPPTLISIVAGSGSATIRFSPPSNTGGSAISLYNASCTARGQTTRTASGTTAAPLTVRNLTGGVLYQCSLTATNSAGLTSSASAALPVTPGKKGNLTPILLLLD